MGHLFVVKNLLMFEKTKDKQKEAGNGTMKNENGSPN